MAVVGPDDSFGKRWQGALDEWRELGSDIGEIRAGIERVAKDEASLAVAEVRSGIRATLQTSVLAGIALVVALVMVAWLPLPLLLALAEAMPLWAAALVTVAVLGLVALALSVLAARRFKRISLVPREALKRVKEDKEWLKQQLFESTD